jgi:hypothetical protein
MGWIALAARVGLGFWFLAFGFWFLSATLGGCSGLCAGIRVLLLVLQALPLCGAAPTFLCRRKEK